MFENLTVLPMPEDKAWVTRLRQGNYIWLAKESQFGIVEWEFRYSGILGRIGFRRYDGHQWRNETWIIEPDGCGIDGKPLFLPVEGHLSDNPEPVEQSDLVTLRQELTDVKRRVKILEQMLWFSAQLNGRTAPFRYPTI